MTLVNSLNLGTYFTRPYTSKDKGTVENRFGQLRRFFLKKTDLSTVSDYQVTRVERLLTTDQQKNLIVKPLTKCYLKKLHLLPELRYDKKIFFITVIK